MYIHYFLRFYDIDARASEQGINPCSGQWEDIGSKMAWLTRTFVLYMSSYNQLDQTLKSILCTIKPTVVDWEKRYEIFEEVQDVVQTLECFRGATVEPCGADLFTRWGDLDISIEMLTSSHISNTARKQKECLLADLQKALESKGTWHKLRSVQARVPFLKLERRLRGISCDISINNLLGQMKAKLLFWIKDMDEHFRDMVLLVKEWAIAHDLKESRSGNWNSYCLTLMVLFHFQTCVPAILPPLKEIYPGDLAHDLSGVRTDAEKQIYETCAMNINRFKLNRSRNESSLSALLISFFAKFSDIDVRALEQGINLYSGCWEDIGSNMAWLPKTFALYVEDPFEQPHNTARAVTGNHLIRMAESFRATHSILASNNYSSATLHAALIRQDRLPPVKRLSFRNKPGSDWSRPQVNRVSSSSTTDSHQTHHNGSSNNENINRPVQPRHSQAHQANYRLTTTMQRKIFGEFRPLNAESFFSFYPTHTLTSLSCFQVDSRTVTLFLSPFTLLLSIFPVGSTKRNNRTTTLEFDRGRLTLITTIPSVSLFDLSFQLVLFN